MREDDWPFKGDGLIFGSLIPLSRADRESLSGAPIYVCTLDGTFSWGAVAVQMMMSRAPRLVRGDPEVDFGSIGTRWLGFEDRLGLGKFSLKVGAFKPCFGTNILSSEICVVIPDRRAFHVDWLTPDSDHLQSRSFTPGNVHVAGGDLGFWFRCDAAPSFFAFSMDRSFVRRIWGEAFSGAGEFEIRNGIDLADPVIKNLGHAGMSELAAGGPAGRIYAESLATALAVHLLRAYGNGTGAPALRRGGLPLNRLRRVLEYIDAHLPDELSLAELATVSGFSANHFASAFKTNTGSSPHRYVIERRIHRARQLLRDTELPISEIAYVVGFSSQSHLTVNFRRIVGLTPQRFRHGND
jgi:AraC family transcriptional regulator